MANTPALLTAAALTLVACHEYESTDDVVPRSGDPCGASSAAHVDIAFNGAGAADVTLGVDLACPSVPPVFTSKRPVLGTAIAAAIASGHPQRVIHGVTFVLGSSEGPPVLPRFDPREDRAEQLAVAAQRVAAMETFRAARVAQQRWLADIIEAGGGRVVNRVALGNILVADVPVGVLVDLRNDFRLRAIGSGVLDDLVNPTSNGSGRSVLHGRQQMLADRLHGRTYTGASYHVGVVDGGVTASHDLLGGVVDLSEDCTSSIAGVCFGNDPTDCTTSQGSQNGHGTQVAALVGGNDAYGPDFAGVSDATLDTWKVSKVTSVNGNPQCTIDPAHIALALENAVVHDEIVNLSISTTPGTDLAEVLAIEAAANEAFQAGAILVAGAGNFGPDAGTIGAPASADNVIATAAVEANGELASYSSIGPAFDGRIKPDIAAPTDLVTGCAASSSCTTKFNGTSAASPMASGAAAALLDVYERNGGWGGAPASVVAGRIYASLIAFGTPLDGSDSPPDHEQGAGLLQLGDTVCSRWRWGTTSSSELGNGSTTVFVPASGAENVRLAIWWTDIPSGVLDLGHADIDLRLSKGATTHVASIAGSSFQRLLLEDLSPGTWTIEAAWAGGSGSRQVHYFWYSEVPDIACTESI